VYAREISYTIIADSSVLPIVRRIQSIVKEVLPEAKEKFIDYKTEKGNKLLKDFEVSEIPFVFFDESLKKDDKKFFLLAQNSIIIPVTSTSTKRTIYALPENVRNIGVKLLNRKRKIGVLDMFVMSFCPYARKAENELIPYMRKQRDIKLKLRFIVKVHKYGINSLHGEEEIEEDIRQILIQKYFSRKIFDYVLMRNKGKNIDDILKELQIKKEELEGLFKEGIELLKKDSEFIRELRVVSSPSFLWENQILIPNDRKLLMEFLNMREKIKKIKKVRKKELYYFYFSDCSSCQEVEVFLNNFLKKHKNLKLKKYDCSKIENLKLLIEFEKRYGRTDTKPAVIFGKNFYLSGAEEIINKLEQQLGFIPKKVEK